MLCPTCGTSVGETLALCQSCAVLDSTNDKDAELSPNTTTAAAMNGSSSAAEKRPRKNTAELKQIYKDALGYSQSEEIVALISHPAILALLCTLGWAVFSLVVYLSLPGLGLGMSVFVSLVLILYASYLGTYASILMGLFYEDRTAFGLCLVGLVGGPYVAFMYREEIGIKKIIFASVCFTLAVIGTITCYQTLDRIPPELMEIFGFMLTG